VIVAACPGAETLRFERDRNTGERSDDGRAGLPLNSPPTSGPLTSGPKSSVDDLKIVVRQEPPGGAPIAPPALITYSVGTGPPDPKDPRKPPVILKQ